MSSAWLAGGRAPISFPVCAEPIACQTGRVLAMDCTWLRPGACLFYRKTMELSHLSRQNGVIRTLTPFLEVIFDGFKGNRRKVVSFYASIEVSKVDLPVSDYLVTMEVSVDISQVVTGQAGRVHRDMSKNQATAHCRVAIMEEGSPDVFEILREIRQSADVVISSYQNFSPVESVKDLQASARNNDIAEVINCVFWANSPVPVAHQHLIHFFH
jgi:hypothetical protein